MTENDFPALRAAVRDSLIGRTIASVTAAAIGAASRAASTAADCVTGGSSFAE